MARCRMLVFYAMHDWPCLRIPCRATYMCMLVSAVCNGRRPGFSKLPVIEEGGAADGYLSRGLSDFLI